MYTLTIYSKGLSKVRTRIDVETSQWGVIPKTAHTHPMRKLPLDWSAYADTHAACRRDRVP